MQPSLLCPVCQAPLLGDERALVCPLRHSFDLSRRGYVNLLSGKHAAVGDNREMIAARRRFLGAGHYAPLSDALFKTASSLAPRHGVYLDAGCGEGYYTEALGRLADATVAIDISKDALSLAARRLPKATLAVASAYRLPLADATVSLLSCIFSPLAAEEFRRVLAPGGYLLYVIPDRRHLFEMKSILYDTPYENEVADPALPGFSLLGNEAVAFPLSLTSQEEIADLFAMTPYYYRTPRRGRERLATLDRLEVGAEFRILAYKKE